MMRISEHVRCIDFPCKDTVRDVYVVPGIEIEPDKIRLVMISECAAPQLADGYYAGGEALFERTTLQAFRDAGAPVARFEDLLAMGVYLTTAIKCGKTSYVIQKETIQNCCRLLEEELAFFPNVAVYLLMGDAAIKAFNLMSMRQGSGRVIPAGSTYKIRGTPNFYNGRRVIPSYLQAGPAFFIEKSKRQMIAEDIRTALAIMQAV
ncbi:MAG: uracil-DNA glycosylase [Anaerolineaceae bacterium]|jgi:hypothetical protein